jgi:spore germination cell wall hydrolase CwlJ-like protein
MALRARRDAALRFSWDGSMTDEEADLVARTVYGEARGEPFQGKLAVAWVIKNRADNPRWWGNNIKDVCMRHAQFSCWLPGDPNREKCEAVTDADLAFVDCQAATASAFKELMPDPTWMADHYYRIGSPEPSWVMDQEPTCDIGHHRFYRLEI